MDLNWNLNSTFSLVSVHKPVADCVQSVLVNLLTYETLLLVIKK